MSSPLHRRGSRPVVRGRAGGAPGPGKGFLLPLTPEPPQAQLLETGCCCQAAGVEARRERRF